MFTEEKADELLYQYGLMDILQKYGQVFIIGSYAMKIMTWNDLDFYFEASGFDSVKYYDLAADLVKELSPVYFEGRVDAENNRMFLGMETEITGERWNIDIWWKTRAEIETARAYAGELACKMEEQPELREAVIKIKQELMKKKLYGMNKGKVHYHSKDIYDAVFREKLLSAEQFLLVHPK